MLWEEKEQLIGNEGEKRAIHTYMKAHVDSGLIKAALEG